MNIVFFIFAIAYAVYQFFCKKEDEEEIEMDPSILKPVLKQYLNFIGFGIVVSILGWMIFKEALLLWLFLNTSILGILLVSLVQKRYLLQNLLFGFSIVAILFCGFRVPTHSDSFQNGVTDNKQLYCPSGLDCVKVSTYIDEKQNLVTKAEIVPITSGDTNWYLIFATGHFSYEDETGKEVNYKGINIAGWWIETTD
ncbi:hypothetical protein [Bacillus sp. JJ1562]|uniref:hypothetical protein n=1 Tax=Bacillus sp. JJ1562 TaxID=3122960 RepID=UPI0030034770